MPTSTFAIRGDYIQLDQLLKATGLAGTGGEAHAAVESGLVRVDGRVENRKRAKLRPGQIVRLGTDTVKLIPADERIGETESTPSTDRQSLR